MTRVFDASGTTRPLNWTVSRAVSDRNGPSTTAVSTFVNSKGILQRAAYGKERIAYKYDKTLRGLLIEPATTNYVDGNYNINGKGQMGTHNSPDPFGANYGNLLSSGQADYEFFDYVAGVHEFAIYVRLTSGVGQSITFGCDRGDNNKILYTVDNNTFTYYGNAMNGTATQAPLGFTRLSFFAQQSAGNAPIVFQNTTGNTNIVWSLMSAMTPSDPNNRQTLIISDGNTAPVTRGADTVSFTLASDATTLTFTFDDQSTLTVSGLTPGSSYTVPGNLPRYYILYIDDNSVKGDGIAITSSGRLGTPLDITARPLYYFDPSVASSMTYDNNNRIQSRQDISGTNISASCPASDITHRPTLASGAIGGLDAIQYRGDNAWDRCSVNLIKATLTLFVIVQPQSATGYSRFASFTPSGGGADYNNINSFDVEQNGGGGRLYLQRNGSTTPSVAYSNSPGVIEALFDGSNGYLYFNGSLVGSIAVTDLFNIIASTFGQSSIQSDGFDGLQGTQMLYDVALSNADRAWVRGALAWQWDGGNPGPLVNALPSNDPYKTSPPRILQATRRRLARFFCS